MESVASPASGHVGTCPPPLALEKFFRYTLKHVVLFGLVLCQTLNLALFVQPRSYLGIMVHVQKLTLLYTARRYALAQSLLSSCVRPSITFVHCIQTAEDIVKHLSWPGSPIILVFLTPSADAKLQPLRLGRKIHGVGKICDFRLKSPSISETIQDRP